MGVGAEDEEEVLEGSIDNFWIVERGKYTWLWRNLPMMPSQEPYFIKANQNHCV